MAQQSADVPERHLAQSGVIVAGKQRLAFSPQALVRVHAAAVIAKQRFRHEGDCFPVLIGDIAHDVLVEHHVVGRFHEGVEALVDFALPAGRHLVVMAFDVQGRIRSWSRPSRCADPDNDRSEGQGNSLLCSAAGSPGYLLAPGVPAAFLRVDEVEGAMRILIEADVVEDKELGFGAEEGGVCDAAVLQIKFGFFGNPARVAVVVLARDRINDIGQASQACGFPRTDP